MVSENGVNLNTRHVLLDFAGDQSGRKGLVPLLLMPHIMGG